jgi:hypothetical protein
MHMLQGGGGEVGDVQLSESDAVTVLVSEVLQEQTRWLRDACDDEGCVGRV